MGRIKPSWYYERQAQLANAREAYYRDRTPPTTPTTIESRGASTSLFYRSLNMISGTDHLIYGVDVYDDTLARVGAGPLGLMTALGAGEVALRMRGSGIKPTKAHWYRGTTTPVRTTTPWGSRVSRYYDDQGGQSHFSAPFSRASGVFNGADLMDAFQGLFGASGTVRAQLGAQNGRAWLELEEVNVAYTS